MKPGDRVVLEADDQNPEEHGVLLVATGDVWMVRIDTWHRTVGDDGIREVAPDAVSLERLSLIGRDRSILNRVAEQTLHQVRTLYAYSELKETPRGNRFELLVDGQYVVVVTVELDRLENNIVLENLGPGPGRDREA